MRATGFGFKSPKDYTGELLYPQMNYNGKNLSLTHKSISESKRENLFLHKSGLMNQIKAHEEENARNKPLAALGSLNGKQTESQMLDEKSIKTLLSKKFSNFNKEGRFKYRDVCKFLFPNNFDRFKITKITEKWGLARTTAIHS